MINSEKNKDIFHSELYVSFDKHLSQDNIFANDLKSVLLITIFKKNMSYFSEFCTTLDRLVVECGYKLDKNRRTQTSIRKILLWFKDNGYIDTDLDINTMSNTDCFKITILNSEELFEHEEFIVLKFKDFYRIIRSESNIKKELLISVFLLIKRNIYNTSYGSGLGFISKNDIKESLHISLSTLNRCIDELIRLEVLYKTHQMWHKKRDGTYSPTKIGYATIRSKIKNTQMALNDYYNCEVISYDKIPDELKPKAKLN